ncbi:MAG: hypothetical protein ACM3KD_01050 [Hyphomicrobiaceae bacterium]
MEIIAHIRLSFRGQFIAEKVESREMFELCRSSGIQYFHGYYFARPENLENKSIQPAQLAVLELITRYAPAQTCASPMPAPVVQALTPAPRARLCVGGPARPLLPTWKKLDVVL